MKTIFLTGCSGGLGSSIYDRFKEEFNIIAPTRAELDLSNPISIENYFEKNNFQNIDILINNAGVNQLNSFIDITHEELLNTFNINTFSPLFISQEIIKRFFLQNKGGQIINIGTFWLSKTRAFRTTYGMSKAALEYLTKSIAIEFGEKNIMCNCISPGFIETKLTRQNNSESDINTIANNIPLKRLAQTNEITELINFLIKNNTYINGENIYIDGGVSKNY